MSAMCLPNPASRSNHTTTCVHTSPWCAWKVKECIIIVFARHRTLCTGSIGPFFSCPPICVCIILHMYIHAHPCCVSPPPSQAHTKGVLVCMLTTIQTKTNKDSSKMYLSLYTRVSTHLIMACSKGKGTETANQTHACIRTETIRDILVKHSFVYLFSLLSYAAYPICGEGGEKEQGVQGCVCVAHNVTAC